MVDVGFWGEGGVRCSVISKSRGLSFSHVVSFFIPGLIFHWRASSIHLNLLFLALRKFRISGNKLCVGARINAHTAGVCA